jgi:hypothetical protein
MEKFFASFPDAGGATVAGLPVKSGKLHAAARPRRPITGS